MTSDDTLKVLMQELIDALSDVDYILVKYVDENISDEIKHFTDKERIEINSIINQYFTV